MAFPGFLLISLIAGRAHGGRPLAVESPRDAEAVHQHAEAKRPERFLEGHSDRPSFGQCLEDTLGLRRVVEAKGDRETLGLLIVAGGIVGAHQDLIAHPEGGMHDFLAPIGRYLVFARLAFIRHDEINFSTQASLIKLERCFALAVEAEVGSQLNGGRIHFVVLDSFQFYREEPCFSRGKPLARRRQTAQAVQAREGSRNRSSRRKAALIALIFKNKPPYVGCYD